MRIRITVVACALLCCAFVGSSAYADVINFDDLVGAGKLPDGYGGVNWHDGWAYFDLFHPNYTPKSGTQRIYPTHLHADNSFDVEPIVFQGAWFSGPTFTTVNFLLYLDHALVATSAGLSPSDVPTFLPSGYSGLVDRIVVHETDHNGLTNYYTMDDVTFDGTPVPAPEPATLSLLAAAAIGLLARNRRRPPVRRI